MHMLNSLASLYQEMGKYVDALCICQRVLTIRERVLGPNHPDIARTLNTIALIYDDQNKPAEALPYYQRSLAIMEQRLGPNHPDVAYSLYILASLYDEWGKHAQALPLYQRAFRIAEESLGFDHPRTQLYLFQLKINSFLVSKPLVQPIIHALFRTFVWFSRAKTCMARWFTERR
jgi:tetratricopeptide (TPR) repeat protein